MKRLLARSLFLAGLIAWTSAGVTSAKAGPYMKSYYNQDQPDGCCNGIYCKPSTPGVVGPWGQPVPMAFPYNASPPDGESAARSMLAQSVPLELQMAAMAQMGPGGPAMRPGAANLAGMGGPGGGMPMPPQGMMGPQGGSGLNPGPYAGNSPGSQGGVQRAYGPASGSGIQQAGGFNPGGGGAPYSVQRTEVRFANPPGMKISWYTTRADGKACFGPQGIEAPGRYNFLQAAIYRLKLSEIPNRPGLELYPTLEVVPCNGKTSTFLSHSAVPVNFTDEDFDQVASGNFVVKVIYLPDPQFQDLAATGLAEVVSSQLEPGVDPIHEAQRRGSILMVVRLGNIDLEAPNTPAMDAPPPGGIPMGPPPGAMMPPQGMGGGIGNGGSRMVPYGMNPNFGGPGGAYGGAAGPAGPGAFAPGGQPGMLPPGVGQPGMAPPAGYNGPPLTNPAAGPAGGVRPGTQQLTPVPGLGQPGGVPPGTGASGVAPLGTPGGPQASATSAAAASGLKQVSLQRPQYLPDPAVAK